MIMLSPFAYADMDYVCDYSMYTETSITNDHYAEFNKYIKNNCERNNILNMKLIGSQLPLDILNQQLLEFSSLYCRFDRNRDIKRKLLSCVLYDNKPRSTIQ